MKLAEPKKVKNSSKINILKAKLQENIKDKNIYKTYYNELTIQRALTNQKQRRKLGKKNEQAINIRTTKSHIQKKCSTSLI